jgi:short subunit fatty acids transporter
VTRENIQQTIFFGQALIILCAIMLVFALVTIAVTLDKKEGEGKTFEELEKKVKKDETL